MDKDKQLMRLSERGRFWRVQFERSSPAEQVFRAVWELEAQVNNGGFDQYFFNDSADTAFAVVGALEAIGALETAGIVAKAKGVFPRSTPPRDRFERQKLLLALSQDQEALLERLSEEFFPYPDDLTELLHAYVRKNSADIPGAVEVGF